MMQNIYSVYVSEFRFCILGYIYPIETQHYLYKEIHLADILSIAGPKMEILDWTIG